jgi:hypothetical protein
MKSSDIHKLGKLYKYVGSTNHYFTNNYVYNLLDIVCGVNRILKNKDKISNYINDNFVEYMDNIRKENTTIDNVNHPKHYTSHPSGIECITITRHYCFAIGNAIKYLWRAGLKEDASLDNAQKEIEDLNKAIWYIKDRIKQIEQYELHT